MKKMLIVRGVTDTDGLKALGLPVAGKFAESEIVVGVAVDGKAVAIKTPEQIDVLFVDSESQIGELGRIIRNIEHSYREQHPDDAHLSQAFVGMWLFFWIGNSDEITPTAIEMIERGDIESLRRSAESFIAADFGNATAGSGKMPGNGGTDPAAA